MCSASKKIATLAASLLLAACIEPIKIGSVPHTQTPMPPPNPAYRHLSAALVIADESRTAVEKAYRFLSALRYSDRISNSRTAGFEPERALRDVEVLFQSSFKTVINKERLEEARNVDVIGVVHYAVDIAQTYGASSRVDLSIDLLGPDRRPLQRLSGSGSFEIAEGYPSTMVDEAEARAFADVALQLAQSPSLGQLGAVAAKKAEPGAGSYHQRALHAFDLGRFEEAITEWQKAYDMDPRPQVLYNLARCYHRRGEINGQVSDLKQARHFYLRFQEREREPDVGAELKRLEELIGSR